MSRLAPQPEQYDSSWLGHVMKLVSNLWCCAWSACLPACLPPGGAKRWASRLHEDSRRLSKTLPLSRVVTSRA